MTAITDATTVIQTLSGRAVANAQLVRIADAFVSADPHSLAAFADPASPTNEEKAQLVMDTFSTWGRQVVRSVAEASETVTVEGQVTGAGDTAAADFT